MAFGTATLDTSARSITPEYLVVPGSGRSRAKRQEPFYDAASDIIQFPPDFPAPLACSAGIARHLVAAVTRALGDRRPVGNVRRHSRC